MQLSEELARAFASMGRLLNDAQGEELSRSDFAVLIRLPLAPAEEAAVRSRDLAHAEGLDPSTMSRRLASLADRGLIGREPDPTDRRASLLTLTPAGRDAVEQERGRRVGLVTDALQEWDDADRAELARLLARLTDTLEDRRSVW